MGCLYSGSRLACPMSTLVVFLVPRALSSIIRYAKLDHSIAIHYNISYYIIIYNPVKSPKSTNFTINVRANTEMRLLGIIGIVTIS